MSARGREPISAKEQIKQNTANEVLIRVFYNYQDLNLDKTPILLKLSHP